MCAEDTIGPVGVAAPSGANVYVSEITSVPCGAPMRAARVAAYDKATMTRSFEMGVDVLATERPAGLAGLDGTLYVCDGVRVHRFDADTGEHRGAFGGVGFAPGAFDKPSAVAATAGHVYVTDGTRLQVLTPGGAPLQSLPLCAQTPSRLTAWPRFCFEAVTTAVAIGNGTLALASSHRMQVETRCGFNPYPVDLNQGLEFARQGKVRHQQQPVDEIRYFLLREDVLASTSHRRHEPWHLAYRVDQTGRWTR